MTITLTYNTTTVELPEALNWSNEYGWSPVEQSTEYSTEGALIIDVALKLAGRPITLEGSEDCTWCTRALCDTLQALASLPGIELTLVQQITLLALLMVTSKGMAGVPRASLVVIYAALPLFHLPETGLLYVLAVDHLLDMGRSATNIVGNSVATVAVTRWERKTASS